MNRRRNLGSVSGKSQHQNGCSEELQSTQSITKRDDRYLCHLAKTKHDQPSARNQRYRSIQTPSSTSNLSQTSESQGSQHWQSKLRAAVVNMVNPNTTELKKDVEHPTNQQSLAPTMVFNKFTREQKEGIRQSLSVMQNPVLMSQIGSSLPLLAQRIKTYLEQLEDNNSKLLEINYFFQKQFNSIITERQIMKREKCDRNYCLECRYHLQKEAKWKKERQELLEQLRSSREVSKEEVQHKNVAIMAMESHRSSKCTQNQQITVLQSELYKKDAEYLILLSEYNYLNTTSKDLKNKFSSLMEEYKYLSIENRTLLNVKTKLTEKELDCAKLKSQRDQLKKKLISLHRRIQQEEEEDHLCTKCGQQLSANESVFTLSSITSINPSGLQPQY